MIVAIDQSSTCCGWAIATPQGKLINSGFCKMPRKPKSTTQDVIERIAAIVERTLKTVHGEIAAYNQNPKVWIDYTLLLEDVTAIHQKSGKTALAMNGVTTMFATKVSKEKLVLTHPATIKKAFTGAGDASKDDMQLVATRVWKLPFYPQEDEADALAHLWVYLNGGIEK